MNGPIRKLAIVGASARAAAFSALRAGYEVVAADLFADADLQRVANVTRIEEYPDGLADWLAATDCDAWMYTGALENHADVVDRMATLRPLLGNCGAELRRVRDPLQLQDALTAASIRFPETRASAEGLSLDGSWLCKTYRGASGSGVWRFDDAAALERAEREGAVFQKFVEGTPAAAVFVLGKERWALLGVTQQLLRVSGRRAWQYEGSAGPLVVSAAITRQLTMLGNVLAKRLQLRGVVGVDLVVEGQSAWIIEINPRYTASIEIVERFTGLPAVAAHVAACDHAERFAPPVTSIRGLLAPGAMTIAKSILYADRELRISADTFDWMMKKAVIDPLRCALADIPHAGETIPECRPVLTAFASGASAAECEVQLQERLAEVRTRLYDG